MVLRIQNAPRIESPRNGYDSEDSHSALMNDECLLWRETEDLVLAPTREIAEQLFVSFCPRNFWRWLKRISFLSILLGELMLPWSTLCDFALLVSDHSVFPYAKMWNSSSFKIYIGRK
ncbi:uncharacterized protein LOC131333944 [Rhododendron vialii]|uniref:uncharacterized protein LOC131333944 n=1 Tax=Rhododendron vialii TaxID=182163 RepID=UPI00265E9D71|nr:uncharacterized protein LOC131333944 [Rhododendron vialii]